MSIGEPEQGDTMTITLSRAASRLAGVIACVAGAAALPYVHAQSWAPTKPVEYSVLAGAGGAVDLAARKMKILLESEQIISQPLIVVNRVGGGGTVAINGLLNHDGDAHYLMSFVTGMFNTRAIGEAPVNYASLTPIAVFLEESIVVAVRADSPLKSGRDLVTKLKGDPGSLTIGIADQLGNHIHVAIAKPLKVAGVDVVKLNVVPYRSSAESMVALLGGHIDLVSASTPNVVSQFQAGKIRLLAVATPDRLSGLMASVPTWREQGVDATFTSIQAVMGPRNMPPGSVRYWEQAIERLSRLDEWKQFLATQYWRPTYMNSAETTKYLDTNFESTKSLLQDLNLVRK
jgi:putative tricarboxylic transport membrane protein